MPRKLKGSAPATNELSSLPDQSLQLPVPVVSQDDGVMVMHFGSDYIQSQMLIDNPDFLALGYTRTMMAFELFQPVPEKIALIGLGGGSIAKWCYRHHPEASLVVVEINQHVIALRDVFRVPQDQQRFKVICEDGAKFVALNTSSFDVLLVDCFNSDQLPPELCSQEFYDSCQRTLTEEGLMVANICGKNYRSVVARIRKSFGGQVLLSRDALGNTVVFACNGTPAWAPDENAESFQKSVKRFERKYRLG
jgi:spermidine synthase